MPFTRIKRIFGKSRVPKIPKRNEESNVAVKDRQVPPSNDYGTVAVDQKTTDPSGNYRPTLMTTTPTQIHNDPVTTGNQPVPKSGPDISLKSSPRETIWEQAYNQLPEDLRKQYAALLKKEWQSQESRDENANQQTQHNFLIQAGLQKLDETSTLQQGLATASKVIQTTRTFIDEAVKVSPEASLIWAGVCVVLPLVTNLQAAADGIRNGFDFATKRLRYYIAFEKFVRLQESSEKKQGPDQTELQEKLHENLRALFESLLELQIMAIIRLYHQNLIQDMFQVVDWTGKKEEIETLEATFDSDWHQVDSTIRQRTLDKIHECIDENNTFLSSLLPLAERTLEVQEEQLDYVKQIMVQKQAEDEKACHQLFRLSGEDGDESYESYKTRVEDRIQGTCEWFLTHPSYTSWLNRPDFPLIVSADPGFGKSVLAKHLVDSRLDGKSPDAILCYFFFKKSQNTVRQVLCALIHQIVSQEFVAIKSAMRAYEQSKEKLVTVVSELWKIFSDIVMNISDGRVIVILDALDECFETDFISRMQHLWERRQEKFTFLATTRPRTSVMSELHLLIQKEPRAYISAADCPEAIANEVNFVIETRAAELRAKNRLDEITKPILVNRLQKFPQRTYLWVHAIFELIKDDEFENSEDAINKLVDVLPKSVHEAYDKALSASKHKSWVRKALCIILAAYRPLTLQEMYIAMHLDSSSSKPPGPYHELELTLRNRCGFLVTISANKVDLLHQTAREFLIEKGFSTESETESGPISEMECHRVLAWSCVSYIEVAVEPNILQFIDEDKDYGSKRIVVKGNEEFLQYTANNWFKHIQIARLDSNKDLADRFRRLCDPQDRLCHIWTEAYHSQMRGNPIDFHGLNTLWMASFTGMTALVERILEKGGVCDTRNRDGQNTLLIAALQGNDRVLPLLLTLKQVRTEVRDAQRIGPLQAAVNSRNPAAVKVLLESERIDVGTWNNAGQTPFESAICDDDPQMTKVFFDSKRSRDACNARNSHGTTPLTTACELRRVEIFQKLVDSGHCDVNSQDFHGRTVLIYSTLFGDEGFVQALLAVQHIDVNIPDSWGETALTWAIHLGRDGMLKKFIGSGKIQVNARDKFGRTVLHRAARAGHSHIVEILLRNSADPDFSDSQGWTSLMEAAFNGHERIVQQLLDTKKVDGNRVNQNGTTALFKATNRGHKAVVQVLLDFFVDANIGDEDDCTPLMIAAFKGDMEIATLLLQSSYTDVNAIDAAGRDAIWYADSKKNSELTQLLRSSKNTRGKPAVNGQ